MTAAKMKNSENRTFVLPDYGIPLEMIWCPLGSFMMGSPETERGHYLNETLHEERMETGFWIGKFPVTQKQYECLTGENPSRQYRSLLMCGEDVPVDSLTHEEAERFCRRLNEVFSLADWKFDLPTSAQWEYACRAGCASALYNGTELTFKYGRSPTLSEIAWHSFDKVTSPQPVGKKQPNAWGIYDMLGNVSEWCREKYVHISTKKHPRGPGGHIVRGGSFRSYPKYCRSACVTGQEDILTLNRFFLRDVGFRVILRKRGIPLVFPSAGANCLRCGKIMPRGKVFCPDCAEKATSFSPMRIWEAVELHDFPLLRHLVEDRGGSPLLEYTKDEKTKCFKPGQTLKITSVPLIAAIRQNSFEMAEYLLAHGADPDYIEKNQIDGSESIGDSVLHKIAMAGNLKLMIRLMAKFRLEFRDGMFRQNLLHEAAENGHADILCFLASFHTLDVNARDCFHWTPLQYAAGNGHFEIVKLLVDDLGAELPAYSELDDVPEDISDWLKSKIDDQKTKEANHAL